MALTTRFLGRQDYQATWRAMQQFTESRTRDTPDEIWVVEHNPVYTLGLNGKREHLLDTGTIPVVHCDRGGQVTYHGPGQLVVYPLLDMKRFHLLLAGASWVAEYGNPDDPADWEFMSKYSPYQNISATAKYPPILITTSTRDDRVHPGHARKMTAALEAAGHRVLYYENIEGGHGGAADNKQAAFKAALTYEFLWQTLGSSHD